MRSCVAKIFSEKSSSFFLLETLGYADERKAGQGVTALLFTI